MRNPSDWLYAPGTQVALTAEPDTASGYYFEQWIGDYEGTDNPTTITMDADKDVTAVFLQLPSYSLAVGTVGEGSVLPSSGSYFEGTAVELTATAAPGWGFSHWEGDASGDLNPLSLNMAADTSITAVFKEVFTPTTEVEPLGTATITVDPPGGVYLSGTVVSITALTSGDNALEHWTGDLDLFMHPTKGPRRNPLPLTIDKQKAVTAHTIVKPGLSDLDFADDLAYFLVIIGDPALWFEYDSNRMTYDEDLNHVFVGNGIPDAAELYLVENVLRNPNVDWSERWGVTHHFAWRAWESNLAQAQTDLAGYDPRQYIFLRVAA